MKHLKKFESNQEFKSKQSDLLRKLQEFSNAYENFIDEIPFHSGEIRSDLKTLEEIKKRIYRWYPGDYFKYY